MSLFINDALASSTGQAASGDGFFSMILIGTMFVLFYFMLIRPQNRRAKEHRELISGLKKGDEIVTSGGILAKVVSLDEQYIKVTVAPNVEISLQRGAVSTVLPKGSLKSL